jgi:predicted LPLAT superfamily acyltransferase
MAERQWAGTTFGNSLMHRWLIALLRVMDIRIVYIFACVFVVPPCLFRPGFKHVYRYFRQRWGFSPVKSFLKTYQNHCMFSQVVIDRFAMYAGKRFNVDIDGYESFLQLESEPGAFIQLSSHIGNYELAGYTLVSAKKPLNALVFGEEKQSVMENRANMFSNKNIRMISIKADMSHLFLIDNALQRGEIVSMPADRIFGSQKCVKEKLLGAEVKLPLGPFSVAAMRGLHVLAVNVMKSSSKGYTIYVKPLHYDQQAPRNRQIEELAHGYINELERMLKMYPTQWYNYFDFWNV